jgi:hypothetical protein
LQEIADHYKNDSNVSFVAIQTTFEGFSVNNFQILPEVIKEYGLTIPVGQNGWKGSPSPLMYRYKTRGTPWVVIIDGNGIIRRSNFHYSVLDSIQIIDYLKKEL